MWTRSCAKIGQTWSRALGRSVVLDASVALKAVLPDALRVPCRALLRGFSEEEAELVAPALWACETTSGLAKAVHYGVVTPEEGLKALDWVHALGVRLLPAEPAQDRRAFDWTLRLRRVAAYDSYYLALAETVGCELWTADERLSRAVDRPWVRVVTAA